MNCSNFLLLLLFLVSNSAFAGSPAEDALDKALFDPAKPEVNTDGNIIIVNGKTIYEKYGREYSIDTKHISWSTAKAVSGILIGIAADQGYFRLSDPVNRYIPEFNGNAKIIDLLQMSSNIEYFEEYDGVPILSDIVRMLYLDGPVMGMSEYTLSRPFRTLTQPGNHFYYSSGDTNLLMEILKKAVGEEKYKTFPWTEFFNKTGMDSATFEQDTSGTYIGSSYIYATVRQFASFMSLLVNGGFHNGVRVIPEAYFKLMNTVAPGARHNHLPGEGNTNYSVQMHTNQSVDGVGFYSEMPQDSLYVYGHQGQMFYAIPSYNTVIVHMGNEYGDGIRTWELLKPSWDFIKEKGYPSFPYKDFENQSSAAMHSQDKKTKNSHSSLGSIFSKIKGYWEYRRVPKLIRTLAAKEMCSCLFVIKRNKYQCRNDLKTTLPIRPIFHISWKKKTVSTDFIIGNSSAAEFVSDRYGCRLLE